MTARPDLDAYVAPVVEAVVATAALMSEELSADRKLGVADDPPAASAPSSAPMTPMAFDLSRISQAENDLRAATLMACWSAGFGTVTTSNMVADDGVIERQRFLVILDAQRSGTTRSSP